MSMSSLQPLRDFIRERLSAAAEEICRHFEETIGHYEAELDRQRGLLDVCGNKAQTHLHCTAAAQYQLTDDANPCDQRNLTNLPSALPQQCLSGDKDLWDLERRVKQEELQTPQIKGEQEERCISQDAEQLNVKLLSETFSVAPVYETPRNGELELELNNEQLLTQSLHEAISQNQRDGRYEGPSLAFGELRGDNNEEQACQKSYFCGIESGTISKYQCQSDFSRNSEIYGMPQTDEQSPSEEMMRSYPEFEPVSLRELGKRISSTVEKPLSCKDCGKIFGRRHHLLIHTRIHTGEKPFSCKECGKSFRQSQHLVVHMRTHTGEKPFSCKECGKDFSKRFNFIKHMNSHS